MKLLKILVAGLMVAPLLTPTISHAKPLPLVRTSPEEAKYTVNFSDVYFDSKQINDYSIKDAKVVSDTSNIPLTDALTYTASIEYGDLPFVSLDTDGVTYIFTEGSTFNGLRTKADFLPTPKSRGYNFIGWSLTPVEKGSFEDDDDIDLNYAKNFTKLYIEGKNAANLTTVSIEDEIHLYPVFEKANIEIKYHLQKPDGTFETALLKNHSFITGETTKLSLPTTLPKGYTFNGWFKDAALTSPVTDNSVFDLSNVKTVDVSAKNPIYYIDVYGKVDPIGGKVTFNAQGGVCAVKDTNYTAFDHTLPVPVKKGNYFLGWFEDKNGVVMATDSTFEKGGDITLYAKWSKITLKTPSIKLKNKKRRKLEVSVKKKGIVEGIVVQISQNKTFSKNSTIQEKEFKGNIIKTTINKAKKGNVYYVRVKTWKKDSTGNPYYSKWSKVEKIKVK